MLHTAAVTNERVRILYTKAPASLTTAILGATIYSLLFKDQIALSVLVLWLGFMFLVTVFRVWLVLDYKKNKDNIPEHSKFENRFIFSVSLIGLGWAFIIFQGLTLPAFEYRIYSLLFLVSIISISVPILSSSMKALYFHVTPSMLISIPLLLARGGNDALLGAALIVFSAMVLRAAKDFYNTLIDSFTARFQAQEMAEHLKQLHHDKLESEQRMQGIMDYAPAAIYVKDLDGHFTFLNQKVADLHKMERKNIIGKTLHDILPEDIADVIYKNDLDVIKTGQPVKYEESTPLDDGLHHFLSIKFPLFDESGKVCAVGGVSTDITEGFRIEESLRISQQRLLLHREQSPLAVIEWNTDFEFLEWNPAAEKIFGFSEEEVQGHHITERILPESARPAVDKIWADLIANKGGFYSLNENITKDGRVIMCEWHNTPLVDHDGNVIGVTSLVDDVTKRQRDEENLRRSQKMDALGKLTGGIAHDFNNLLAIILGYAELLELKLKDQPKLEKYSHEVLSAGKRGARLTNKLLAFSSTEMSEASSININELLYAEQDMLIKTLTVRIKLVLDLDEALWSVWLNDSDLEDAILNLCINAMHAIEGNGQITIQTKNAELDEEDVQKLDLSPGDYVLLRITDTGCGMDDDTKEKIFEPFYSTKGEKGTGLGLSQLYGFVERSAAAIKVNSALDHGSEFLLYFPRYIGDDKNIITKETSTNHVGGNETILVVDDELALLNFLSEVLSQNGYNVLCAERAEQALKIMEKESIDLMLSDVIMPEMNGYQLASIVQEKHPDIKIQMASGFTDDSQLGIKDESLHENLLRKPYQAQLVLKRIRSLLDE